MIKPVGWKVLIKPVPAEEKSAGGVYLPDRSQDEQKIAAVCCEVIDMGPDAYSDVDKFPHGAWCKVGDYVLIGKFVGSRIKYKGDEYRFINDDEVVGLTENPGDVARV